MKYENAKELLPEELLKQVQKYAGGKLLYIPISEDAKAWGTASGYRQKLLKRNQMIYNEFVDGKTIAELADEHFLSLDSIKKIVYGKKDSLIAFEPTIACAVQYSEAGLAEEWIRAFYVSGRHDIMTLPQQYMCFGITKMPLRLICGMEQVATQRGTLGVETMQAQAQQMEGVSVPAYTVDEASEEPLVVRYVKGHFYLFGQREVFLRKKARKINAYPVFILITDRDEYQSFMKDFGKHFQPVRLSDGCVNSNCNI